MDGLCECSGEDGKDIRRPECLRDSAEIKKARSNAARISHVRILR